MLGFLTRYEKVYPHEDTTCPICQRVLYNRHSMANQILYGVTSTVLVEIWRSVRAGRTARFQAAGREVVIGSSG
jgi:hypothetical protein